MRFATKHQEVYCIYDITCPFCLSTNKCSMISLKAFFASICFTKPFLLRASLIFLYFISVAFYTFKLK